MGTANAQETSRYASAERRDRAMFVAPTYDRDTLARLTPSEHRVLALLAEGLAPKQAAWELQVAISTVRSHIAAAKRKTGARTLQQLVGTYAVALAIDPPGAVR